MTLRSRRVTAELIALVLIAILTLTAFARHHRPVAQPAPYAGSFIERMMLDVGSNPTGWARAWCGEYLGLIAKALGFRPPPDFPQAYAWRKFGRPAPGPAPGVVAVMRHHVGVVRRVLTPGAVELVSGNHGHRVGVGVYPTRRVIAWRRP